MRNRYWYGIYDINMNLIEEYIYQGSYNHSSILNFIVSNRREFVFCGADYQLNDRGNGAYEKAKGVVFSTNLNGQIKWYHEIWDSLNPKDEFIVL
ncbi:MAG: hypothetical protein IPP06_06650 [Saprospiraceae bacterium]|nr:hypothetical protein [Candidatus Vicinibacter affinis]